MVGAREIVLVIQSIPAECTSMRFLISLADAAYKYGGLTQRQETAFLGCIGTLKEMGVLA